MGETPAGEPSWWVGESRIGSHTKLNRPNYRYHAIVGVECFVFVAAILELRIQVLGTAIVQLHQDDGILEFCERFQGLP